MEKLSTSLALCERNPVVTGWLLISNAELWCLLRCYPEQAVEQTVELRGCKTVRRRNSHVTSLQWPWLSAVRYSMVNFIHNSDLIWKIKGTPKGRINNIPALVQILVWRRRGDKPLSEPMMVSLLAHICVIRPQWVRDGIMKKICHISCEREEWHFLNMVGKLAERPPPGWCIIFME